MLRGSLVSRRREAICEMVTASALGKPEFLISTSYILANPTWAKENETSRLYRSSNRASSARTSGTWTLNGGPTVLTELDRVRHQNGAKYREHLNMLALDKD